MMSSPAASRPVSGNQTRNLSQTFAYGFGLVLLASGCASTDSGSGSGPSKHAAEARPAVTDLLSQPGESALISGLRAYEDAQYPQAERHFQSALGKGLAAPKDRAAAHKHLAFLYCTSNRIKECEAAFRAARAADPNFRLNKSESGHPQWGPVYKRVFPG
jgi:hypothetical protein